MRPIKQAGVVSTHTLLAFAPAAATLSVGASLQLLHVTREAFLFVSACMLAYSVRDLPGVDHRTFWSRRFALVGIPYLCWTLIYFALTLPTTSLGWGSGFVHLLYLVGTGYYQLYYLLVLLEFYLLFPLLLGLLRRTAGHQIALLAASALVQVTFISLMHWGVTPAWLHGYWATREVTSYQFYLIAGMVVAFHLEEFHNWVCRHWMLVVGGTTVAAALAEFWYFLAAEHVASWMGSSSDPFQPIVIPFNVGAIACIYLVGVGLVHRTRSQRTRAAVRSGSDNSYGIYLAQVLFLTVLGWLGWHHLNESLPWPVVSVVTVALVFVACIGLTEVLARTPFAKPLTGRTRVRSVTRAEQSASMVRPISPQPDGGGPSAVSIARTSASAMAE